MKKVILATSFAAIAASANAGAYTPPVTEQSIIIEETASSTSHQWLVPVTLLLILFLVL